MTAKSLAGNVYINRDMVGAVFPPAPYTSPCFLAAWRN